MREFLAASEELVFTLSGRGEIYNLVERTLGRQQYLGLPKKDKGVVRHYLSKLSGRSLPQITRLIRQYRQSGVLALLAAAEAHDGPGGAAHSVAGILRLPQAYQRLASISSSHIYNLRRGAAYRQHHVHHTKTRARAVSIGERRKPERGRPGYLRVDTDSNMVLPLIPTTARSQLPGREIVEQTAGGGVHQVAGASHNRQRAARARMGRWCANTSDTNRSEPSMPESFSVSTWPATHPCSHGLFLSSGEPVSLLLSQLVAHSCDPPSSTPRFPARKGRP